MLAFLGKRILSRCTCHIQGTGPVEPVRHCQGWRSQGVRRASAPSRGLLKRAFRSCGAFTQARNESSENYADRVAWASAGTETAAPGGGALRSGGATQGDSAPRTAVPTAAAQDGGCLCVQARRGASRCRTALLLKWRPPAFPVWNAPFRDPLVLKWPPLSSRSQSRARCSIESGTRHSSESPSIGGPKE